MTAVFMTVAVFSFILLLGNLLKEILQLLVNQQASLGLVLKAVAFLLPYVLVFALPMGLLTATLLVFGRLSADHELTALRSAGVSLLSAITPVLLLSLFFSALCALINLEVGPRCRLAYKQLINRVGLDASTAILPAEQFIKEIPGYILYVGENKKGELRDVSIYKLDSQETLTEYSQADRGRVSIDPTNRQVVLTLFDARVAVRQVDGEGPEEKISWQPFFPGELTMSLKLSDAKKPRRVQVSDMSFTQLWQEKQVMEKVGTVQLKNRLVDPVTPILVNMHRQVAFSFACVAFTLVGIPLGIRAHRRETSAGFAMAIVLVMIYYSFIIVGQSLDRRTELAPYLLVWLPNFIFQAIGAVLLARANRGW